LRSLDPSALDLPALDPSDGGLDRRKGLWALKAFGDAPLPLFAAAGTDIGADTGNGASHGTSPRSPAMQRSLNEDMREARAAALLPAMPLGEHVVEDYATTRLSIKRHPLAFLRRELAREGLVPAAALATLPVERRFGIAGLVLIRQRPGSANGVIFLTIEDETGVANLIVWPPVLERFRRAVLGATLLYCRGRLQREESVIHLVAEELRDWTPRLNTLRERTGNEPLPRDTPPRNGRAAQSGRIPGYDPQDIVIASRDFR
jgi:error-prone DNA polymerase